MEWPVEILDEIWNWVRLYIRPRLKKRLWESVHSDLVPAARWNIARIHSCVLREEYESIPLQVGDDYVITGPHITNFACERWVLHVPYALAEGAAWWPHTTDEDDMEVVPETADQNGLPGPQLPTERREVLSILQLAWKSVEEHFEEYLYGEEGEEGEEGEDAESEIET